MTMDDEEQKKQRLEAWRKALGNAEDEGEILDHFEVICEVDNVGFSREHTAHFLLQDGPAGDGGPTRTIRVVIFFRSDEGLVILSPEDLTELIAWLESARQRILKEER